MIGEDFAFFGFDEESWDRLVSLILGESEPHGVLVMVVNRAAVPVAAFHTARGSIDPSTLPGPGDLEALCQAAEAGACILMRERAMSRVEDYLAAPFDPDQDFVTRVMRFAHVLRELGNGNWVRVWPNPFPDILLAAAPAAKSATDLALPDGQSVVLGVFDRGELWTGAVLRRREGSLDVFAGPRAISEWAGPLGGDWQRDHRVLTAAVQRELGPLHLGLFMERETAQRLFRNRQPGDWAMCFTTREIMVHPMPAFAAAGFGVDVVRGAAQLAFQVLDGIEADELSAIAQGFWKGFTDGKGLEGILGFSPADLISTAVERLSERPPPPPPPPHPHRTPRTPTWVTPHRPPPSSTWVTPNRRPRSRNRSPNAPPTGSARSRSGEHRCTDRLFFDRIGDNLYLYPTC